MSIPVSFRYLPTALLFLAAVCIVADDFAVLLGGWALLGMATVLLRVYEQGIGTFWPELKTWQAFRRWEVDNDSGSTQIVLRGRARRWGRWPDILLEVSREEVSTICEFLEARLGEPHNVTGTQRAMKASVEVS